MNVGFGHRRGCAGAGGHAQYARPGTTPAQADRTLGRVVGFGVGVSHRCHCQGVNQPITNGFIRLENVPHHVSGINR